VHQEEKTNLANISSKSAHAWLNGNKVLSEQSSDSKDAGADDEDSDGQDLRANKATAAGGGGAAGARGDDKQSAERRRGRRRRAS
jgi:hypothetical protein